MEIQLQTIYNLFTEILSLPNHSDCTLVFGSRNSGSICGGYHMTRYFTDEDDIIYEHVEWKNFDEAIDVLQRYISHIQSKPSAD